MRKFPVITGKDLIKFLESIGFKVTRTKESHVRLRSEDGRATTVPVHKNKVRC
ncbi:MAG: type II toxin-antitoxin system HicA family toxin [Nanoarchaeota archaeon]|nr:type II toxin-antitoxin system HicA family toxin [Nanoarchaeota archaeon]